MKTNLTQIAVMTILLCGVSPQVFCDLAQPNNPPQAPNATLTVKPVISPSSTSADLDNYVQYLRQQGYQILDRQQQLNGAGTVASFHLRAARPAGTPKAGGSKSFVLVNGDYRNMTVTETNEAENASGVLSSKPPLSMSANKGDLEKYVRYYRRQGYTVTRRQEKLNSSGKLLLFRFHAVRNSGTLSIPSDFVDAVVTPRKAEVIIASGRI